MNCDAVAEHPSRLTEPYTPRLIDHLIEIGTYDDAVDFLRDRRVELNALTSRQLIDIIERALAGLAKVIPGPRTLADAYRRWLAVRLAHQETELVLPRRPGTRPTPKQVAWLKAIFDRLAAEGV